MKVANGEYFISTDKSLLDIAFVHAYLTRSYWAEGIPYETVERSVKGAVCFAIYREENGKQIGFARLITDETTFAYLADVFIDEAYRGKGLSKWLMKVIMESDSVQGLRRLMLATRDAHGLYAQFGFSPLTNTDRWMHIHYPDRYKNQ
jgi:N-acetylglutamate synthase-like GNAT family acetyltransferase